MPLRGRIAQQRPLLAGGIHHPAGLQPLPLPGGAPPLHLGAGPRVLLAFREREPTDRSVVAAHDKHFSHRIRFKGVTDQHQSGRCWLFAGLNTLRPAIIAKHNLDGFEFSQSYLQFWDKLEKSNLYLEYMIELRDTDPLDRDWEAVHKWTLDDGGWWQYVVALVSKYD